MTTALTDAQIKRLRSLLEAKRRELLEHAARERGAMVTDEPLADSTDAATRTMEETEILDGATRERGLLAEVAHALAKFDDGSYGVSEESGEPIPFGRLQAVPWARHLVDEEERIECAR